MCLEKILVDPIESCRVLVSNNIVRRENGIYCLVTVIGSQDPDYEISKQEVGGGLLFQANYDGGYTSRDSQREIRKIFNEVISLLNRGQLMPDQVFDYRDWGSEAMEFSWNRLPSNQKPF